MNSIALLIWIVATSGQVGAVPGFKVGWKPDDKGRGLCYIVQVTPDVSNAIATGGQELAVDIPDYLQGKVSQVVWRTGLSDVEREPSTAELQANPRAYLPSSAQNTRGPGSLTNLSDSSGQMVNLDPVRSNAAFPVNVGREADLDPTMPAVPSLGSLAQNFSTPNSRNSFGNPDPTGTFPPNSNSSNSLTMPKTTSTYPAPSSFHGPTLPSGYNNTPLTTAGTPSTFTGPNPNNSNPYGSNPNSNFGSGTNSGLGANSNNVYGPNTTPVTVAANPNGVNPYGATNYGQGNGISAGTFGGGNNYQPTGTGNTFPPSGNNAYNPANQNVFSSAANSPYTNPYTNTQLNGTNASPPYYPNSRPDYLVSQNLPMNSATNPGYPGASTSSGYGPPPYLPSSGFNQQPQLMANTPPPIRQNSTDANRWNENYGNRLPLGSESVSAPNYFATLFLLVSLVGNAYLFWLLTNLLQRYRTLQANSRGLSSLGV